MVKKKDKEDRLKRAQDSEATRTVLSKVTRLSGLQKRPLGKDKDIPVMITPYDSLIGKYKGRLTYVRIEFTEEGTPKALDINMIHKAKVLTSGDLDLEWVMKGLCDETEMRLATGLIETFARDLWKKKETYGNIERARLNDVHLNISVRIIKSEDDLVRLLDIMSELCDISEARNGRLMANDIPTDREFRLVGNGLIKFEPEQLVYTDPLKRAKSYGYDDILLLDLEEFEDSEALDFILGITFKDNVKVIFEKKYDTAQARQGVRALILDGLGLLRLDEEPKVYEAEKGGVSAESL